MPRSPEEAAWPLVLDVDSGEAEQYLGNWLDSDAAVQSQWDDRVVRRIQQRLHSLRESGLPRASVSMVASLCRKCCSIGIAVFYVTNQTPRNYTEMVRKLTG